MDIVILIIYKVYYKKVYIRNSIINIVKTSINNYTYGYRELYYVSLKNDCTLYTVQRTVYNVVQCVHSIY